MAFALHLCLTVLRLVSKHALTAVCEVLNKYICQECVLFPADLPA